MKRSDSWWINGQGVRESGSKHVTVTQTGNTTAFSVPAFGAGELVWNNGIAEGTFKTARGDMLDVTAVRDPNNTIHYSMTDPRGTTVSEGTINDS